MDKNLKAFVLMPFDPEFDSIYKELIKPALEDSGYEVERADSLLDQQNIMCDVVRGIANADLVVADLTALNPNVLYELGLCHGLGIPTILLTQSMDEVPFDLRPYKIQIYSTRFDEVHRLKEAIKRIGEKHKNREIAFGSPITDFLPPEGHALTVRTTGVPTKEPEEMAAEEAEGEKGFLDFILEGTEAAEELSRVILEITKETENIAGKMSDHAARMQVLTKNRGPGTAAQAHEIASIVAVDITAYSERIEENLPRLGDSTDTLTESYFGYITWIEPKSQEDKKQVTGLRQNIARLLEGTKTSLEGLRLFLSTVAGLRGISREINRASRRLSGTLDSVIVIFEKIEAFCVRTLPLIDEKVGNK